MSTVTDLYKTVLQWEAEATASPADSYPFKALLDELLFHADLRYRDYLQYRGEGQFPTRLRNWLHNVVSEAQRKDMFRLLRWLVFIDQSQMRALYRDAYRRIIVPWLSFASFSPDSLLSSNYKLQLLGLLRQYRLLSITQSFSFTEFERINDLAGLPKANVLSEDPTKVSTNLPKREASVQGLILLEDFVGTGKQAGRVLKAVKAHSVEGWRILFVPLMILERGLSTLRDDTDLEGITIAPVIVVPTKACLQKRKVIGEPEEFRRLRALTKSTAAQVRRRLHAHDDPPAAAFGYGGCGALLVTSHNTPNNTLPMIHHRAPLWSPLFRRLHHSEDG